MERMGVILKPGDFGGNCIAAINPAVHFEEEKQEISIYCRTVYPDRTSEIRRVVMGLDLSVKEIDPEPTLKGESDEEKLGCEDPRFTKINECYYLTYTAVQPLERHRTWRTRIGLARSDDLAHFHRIGLVLNQLGNNKNGVLLSERIGDRFFLYHRQKPNIWCAHSHDLYNWHGVRKVMSIRPFSWDSVRIGMGTILKTDDGWLAFYHGADSYNIYRLGVALFDHNHPDKLLARSQKPILEPETSYERDGLVPNIVFSCGAFSINGSYIILYGAADRVTAACEISKKEVLKNLIPVR